MFLHEVEAQGLVVGHIQVVTICEVSVILPAISERDFLVVLVTSPKASHDLCWERVSMVGFVKQCLQGGALKNPRRIIFTIT